MKYTLRLNQSFPFASNVPFVELEDERILCNDIRLPGESHCYDMRLWVIGNEYGPMGAVWASNESDAIDELIDANLAGGILLDDEIIAEREADGEEMNYGGNAGEAYDSEHLWMAPVQWDKVRDYALIVALAEARGACATSLKVSI